ncbi:helix-turn-helix domain-containing protein [Lamprobacter modestohalophilus]|uniref:HVO_A0114 family putative DNA-binding protein n=1 Tax=Lamprobacter modestohalophilus TaxID=1064514 RepID=UPI002ADECCDB|nr:helix-turn-helix domain-containing protein [Lamprobacter modestohalophilus]MEA1050755.1 helix-turn-helix domain-containing protein [Lamprobacter modestohalophilus]
MKAIIEVGRRGSIFDAVTSQVADGRAGRLVDYRLSFESTQTLFAEVTPERLELLDHLRRIGPCRAEELADQLPASSDPTVFTHHLERLETLDLLERHEDGTLFVPFASIEIILPLARVA